MFYCIGMSSGVISFFTQVRYCDVHDREMMSKLTSLTKELEKRFNPMLHKNHCIAILVLFVFMGINFREISERICYPLGSDPGKFVFNEYICETAVFHRHVASGGGGGVVIGS